MKARGEAMRGEVRAGGRFFARTDAGEEQALTLRTLTVRATTRPGTVRSHLAMEIAGPRDQRVEAVMRLPVPRGAAVTGAVLWVDGRPMNGAFVERGRAQQIYGAIVARRRDPALVTWDGPGWVAVSIFPLERGEPRRFELEWVEPAAVDADGKITYRVPIVSERARLVGQAALEVDGRPIDAGGRDRVALAPPPSDANVVVGRAPGDPFARVLVRGQPASGAARVAIVAETSAAMTTADRVRQRETIAAVLGGLPAEARVSLLAADWDVAPIADEVAPSAAIAALAKLDAVVSAGALRLGRALAAARVGAGAPGAVLFVGRGMDAFGDDAVRAPLAAFRAAGAPLSAVTLSGLPWPFVDAAALTGGQAIAAPLDAEGLAVLLRALGPRPTRPAVALRGVDDWRPLETIAGQPVWIGRALGAAAAPDAGAAVPVEGDAGDLLALWDRDRLVWFDGGRGRTERTPPAALTPLRALLVLESEQDYVRHGLAVPEPIADTARGDGHYGQDSALAPPAVIGDDASDVLGHLVGNQIADAYGVGGLGIVGTGSGGGGPGLDLHTIGKSGGEGNGSGYGRSAGGLGGRRASAPEVIPGQATVRGALDREIIRRIVRRHINEVRFCYDQALKANPFLGGSVVVQFTIAASGTVIASTLQSSTLGDRAVESCLVADVKRWEFPRPYGGGIVIASYPFEFVPGASGEPSAATLGDPAVTEALAILAGSGPLAGRVARVAARLDLPETADAESLAWTIDRSQAKLDLLVLVARLLVAAARTHDAVRVLSERAAVSPRPIAAELRRIGQEGDARDVLARGGRGR